MISIGLSQTDTTSQILELERAQPQSFIAADLTISCINSPNNVTVSGPSQQLKLLLMHLQKQNFFARQLTVNLAYHSPQMEGIASEYLERLQRLERRDQISKSVMVSSVTCKIINADSLCSGHYWVRNMVSQVKFSEAMMLCCFRSYRENIVKKLDRSHVEEIITHAWMELGPHSTLRGPIRDILKSVGRSNEVKYDSALVRNLPATHTFLNSVGSLYCQNAHVALAKLNFSDDSRTRPLATLPCLPQYPFNHSTIYWEESQSNRSLLFRKHATHELLGTQVIDWNPMEAKWIFIIKADDLPWITDHKINGSILYPAAGMLAAAIEAVKLMVKNTSPIGYEIRNTEFTAPLLLTESPAGTETQISLSSPTRPKGRDYFEYFFRVFSRKADEAWEDICHGSIRADYGRAVSDVDGGRETNELLSRLRSLHQEGVTSCARHVDSTKMYRQLREEVGIEYGPSFQVLGRIHCNGEGDAMAVIDISKDYAMQFPTSHVIRPTTLDGLFQLLFVALTKGGTESLQTMVPSRLGRVWISSSEEKESSPATLQVHARAWPLSKRSAQCCISALDASSQQLKAHVEDFETTAVSGNTHSELSRKEAKKICYHMSWKPDLDTLGNDSIQKYCEDLQKNANEPNQWFIDLELLCLCFGAQVLTSCKNVAKDYTPSLIRYVSWLQMQLDQYITGVSPDNQQQRKDLLDDRAYLGELCERIKINERGKLYVKVGEQLHNTLIGDTDPLELLFGNQNHLAAFYTEMIMSSQAFDSAACYLCSLIHKTPSLELIEFGAGTGATTRILLNTLAASPSTPLFKQYVFTDVSPAFLEKAREQFSGQKRMDFRVLDIEEDPCAQGFSESQYDVLVASLVFHATKDLSATLQRARKMLKPGGKLILMELTAPDNIRTGFVFGLLPGWWVGSEPFRQRSPCISTDQWKEILLKNSFSGNDLVFKDYETEECQMWCLIVSTAVEPTLVVPMLPSYNLVLDKNSKDQRVLAGKLAEIFEVPDGSMRMLSLQEAALTSKQKAQHHIVLIDYSNCTLSGLEPATFTALQGLITTSASIVWVMRGGGRARSNPHYGMLQGLHRVCRNENPKVAIVSIALESAPGSLPMTKDAALILNVLRRTALGLAKGVFEPEYMVIDSLPSH